MNKILSVSLRHGFQELRTISIDRYRCRLKRLIWGGCNSRFACSLSTSSRKKIGIVGYWATSISTVRSTVLSKKSDKYGFISGFEH